MKNLNRILGNYLSSKYFFYCILALLLTQALWVAISLNLGGINDEIAHFKTVEVYSLYSNPFHVEQKPEWDSLGDVTRSASYFYYFGMGKALNLISVFTTNHYVKVLTLRLMNTFLFLAALIIFRKVLMSVGFSQKIANFALLMLVLIPVFPLLAGQINYDNAVFFMAALLMLLAVRIIISKAPNIMRAVALFVIGTLGSFVKFAFLPLFLATLIFLTYSEYRKYRTRIFSRYRIQWRKLQGYIKVSIVILLMVSLSLLIERHGVNVLKYGSITPACDQTMSSVRCASYDLWLRNKNLAETRPARVSNDPYKYTGTWLSNMTLTMYRVDPTLSPPPISFYTFHLLVILSIGLSLYYLREHGGTILKRYLLFTTTFFIVALILHNYYSVYLQTGRIIATNGRYLLPVMPILLAVFAQSFSYLFKKRSTFKNSLAIMITLLMLQGGGVSIHILQSNRAWFWSDNISRHNDSLREKISPFIVD